jgi:hypothetical protein
MRTSELASLRWRAEEEKVAAVADAAAEAEAAKSKQINEARRLAEVEALARDSAERRAKAADKAEGLWRHNDPTFARRRPSCTPNCMDLSAMPAAQRERSSACSDADGAESVGAAPYSSASAHSLHSKGGADANGDARERWSNLAAKTNGATANGDGRSASTNAPPARGGEGVARVARLVASRSTAGEMTRKRTGGTPFGGGGAAEGGGGDASPSTRRGDGREAAATLPPLSPERGAIAANSPSGHRKRVTRTVAETMPRSVSEPVLAE